MFQSMSLNRLYFVVVTPVQMRPPFLHPLQQFECFNILSDGWSTVEGDQREDNADDKVIVEVEDVSLKFVKIYP